MTVVYNRNGWKMEMTKKIKKNVRTPVQQRAKSKKNRIVKVAYDFMKESGYEAMNIRLIAQKAGVSIGTIYSYFSDKKAIYYDVLCLYRDESFNYLKDTLDQSLEKEESLEEAIYSFIVGFENVIKRNLKFHKEIIALSLIDEWFSHTHIEMETENANAFGTRFLEKFKNQITVTDRKITFMLVHKTIEEIVQYLLFYDIKVPHHHIFREIAQMIAGHLTRPMIDPDRD